MKLTYQDIWDLLGHIGNVQTLADIVTGSILEDCLIALGDVHCKAAVFELQHLEHSENKRDVLNRATVHLLAGFREYRASYPKTETQKALFYSSFISTTIKAQAAGMMLTLCYLYLGDKSHASAIIKEMKTSAGFVTEGHASLEEVDKLLALPISVLNPLTYIGMATRDNARPTPKDNAKSDFYTLYKNMGDKRYEFFDKFLSQAEALCKE